MTQCNGTDSWIFLAIAQSSGSPLSWFYAVADYLNVAIPSDEEVESSANRLISSGLITVDNNSFSITTKGQEIFEAVQQLSAYPRPQVHLAIPLLSKVMEPEISQSAWHLDPNVAADALSEYRNRIRKKSKLKGKKHRPKDKD